MNRKGHAQYMQAKVLTASKEQLVLMLYDGAVRFCEAGKAALEEKDYEKSHNALVRAQDIILELAYSLDREKGGDLAEHMAALYDYCYRRLISANVEHTPTVVAEVQKILGELRDAWAQAMEKAGVTTADGPDEAETTSQQPSAAPDETPQPSAPPAAPAKPKGVPLARVPIAKMPVNREGPAKSSFSAQG